MPGGARRGALRVRYSIRVETWEGALQFHHHPDDQRAAEIDFRQRWRQAGSTCKSIALRRHTGTAIITIREEEGRWRR